MCVVSFYEYENMINILFIFILAFSDKMLHFHALLAPPPNYTSTCVWNMIKHQLTIISDKREFPRTVSDFEENHWQPFGKSFLLPSSILHFFHSFFCDATKLIVTFSDFLVDVALHFGKGWTSNLGVSPVFRQPVNLRFFSYLYYLKVGLLSVYMFISLVFLYFDGFYISLVWT